MKWAMSLSWWSEHPRGGRKNQTDMTMSSESVMESKKACNGKEEMREWSFISGGRDRPQRQEYLV